MYLNVQVNQLEAFGLHTWHCFFFLFQGLTMCLICIIVITYVSRSPAAAPGNYQMRPVRLPSSLFRCESLKLPGINTLQNPGEFRGCVFLNDTFLLDAAWTCFFEDEGKERIRGEKKKSARFYSCWPNTFSLTWCITLNFPPVCSAVGSHCTSLLLLADLMPELIHF